MIKNLEGVAFLIALILPLVPVVFLIVKIRQSSLKSKNVLAFLVLFFLTLLINPYGQYLLLEGWDTSRNYSYALKANNIHIIGKTPSQVKEIFGEPERTWRQETFTYNGKQIQECICWEYKPLPGYWLGGHFQVFFTDGVVSSFEANDD
jgi:hypothetical protein